MTTIMEEPYMMHARQDADVPTLQGNDRYQGFCKDLASLIEKEANVKFEIRVVKDGKYGSPDPNAPGARFSRFSDFLTGCNSAKKL